MFQYGNLLVTTNDIGIDRTILLGGERGVQLVQLDPHPSPQNLNAIVVRPEICTAMFENFSYWRRCFFGWCS